MRCARSAAASSAGVGDDGGASTHGSPDLGSKAEREGGEVRLRRRIRAMVAISKMPVRKYSACLCLWFSVLLVFISFHTSPPCFPRPPFAATPTNGLKLKVPVSARPNSWQNFLTLSIFPPVPLSVFPLPLTLAPMPQLPPVSPLLHRKLPKPLLSSGSRPKARRTRQTGTKSHVDPQRRRRR